MSNKTKGRSVSLYEKLRYIRQENCLSLVLHFSEVNTFHIILECLISVYMLELLAILSKFFLVDPTNISSLLMLIVFPCVITISLSAILGIICALFFTNRVYYYLIVVLPISSEKTTDLHIHYEKVVRRYRQEVIRCHLIGLIFYCVSTYFVPQVLVHNYSSYFAHPNAFRYWMFFVGSLLGVFWNTAGIFRNQRLLWSELVTKFSVPEIRSTVYQHNYKLLRNNAITNILSITFLCIVSVTIVFNIHPILMKQDSFESLLTEYSFFVLSFGVLVAFYLKKGVSLLYSDHAALVFPSLNTILDLSTSKP